MIVTNSVECEAKAIVGDFYAKLVAGDIDGAISMLAADVRVYEADSLPYAGEHHGVDGVMTAVGGAAKLFLVDQIEVQRLIGDGDQVAALASVPIRAAVSGARMLCVEWWVVRDGLIAECRPFYLDTAALL
jgi:hypothetical protein